MRFEAERASPQRLDGRVGLSAKPKARSANRVALAVSASLALVLVSTFAVVIAWTISPTQALEQFHPDSKEYAHAAVALTRGQYAVEWDGTKRLPVYPPGFPALLAPAVAIGGVEASVWVPFSAYVLLGILAALLGGRLGGPLAAPLAVLAVLCTGASATLSRVVMSDLSGAALTLLEVTLLTFSSSRAARFGAGMLGGMLVWLRYANAPLLFAGLAALTAQRSWRQGVLWYFLGAAPALASVGVWQWRTFGSPLQSTYGDANAVSVVGPVRFGLEYVLGQPGARDPHLLPWDLPNVLHYTLQLTGVDFTLAIPGFGLLGLIMLMQMAWETGAAGTVGRFGLVALAATAAVYLPYSYQSARFFMVPAILLSVASAVCWVRLSARVATLSRTLKA